MLLLFLVLVWPLCGSGGEGGSRVPLAFGWEVPVSVPRLAGRKRQGARDVAWSSGHLRKRAKGNGMNFVSDRVDGLVNLLVNYDALNIYKVASAVVVRFHLLR